jgi:osmotically-inducible protein OsmY
VSAQSEPYDDSHRADDLSAEPELAHRVREALRADAATTNLVDRLVVGTRASTVVVRGIVDGIEDTDAIMEVVDRVDGVDNVVDQTDIPKC